MTILRRKVRAACIAAHLFKMPDAGQWPCVNTHGVVRCAVQCNSLCHTLEAHADIQQTTSMPPLCKNNIEIQHLHLAATDLFNNILKKKVRLRNSSKNCRRLSALASLGTWRNPAPEDRHLIIFGSLFLCICLIVFGSLVSLYFYL